MGLDMYLRAEKYVSGYEFYGEERVEQYKSIVESLGATALADPNTPSLTVSITVAYWRKANQIHQWFVDNVQGGEDECRPHDVLREQLAELRDLCKEILEAGTVTEKVAVSTLTEDGKIEERQQDAEALSPAGIAKAEELLPTQSGFFFGGTEYDHWYVEDLKSTVEQIDRVLEAPDEWWFKYQSSW